MKRKRRRILALAVAQGSVLVLAIALASSSAAAVANGNSGTVKIDGVAFGDHHANEPHPSCEFRVTFWGYGEDREATATFSMKSPTRETTGPGTIAFGPVDVGTDAAGGGNDPDGEIVADLTAFLAESGATAHEKQGYHVKLTVNAPGSQGADVKHKVFWITCEADVEGTNTGTDDDTDVLGATVTRGPDALAATGSETSWLAIMALSALLLGLGLRTVARRKAVTVSRI